MTTIRKHLLRAAGIVLAASLLTVIAAWIWMATLDLQAQRGRIETTASRMLGRAMHIDGPLSLSPSLFPRVSITDVHIANPGWAAQPDFVAVRQLEVEINPWALLHKRIEIRDVELTGATVNLQRGPDQDATWYFNPGAKQGSAPGEIPDIAALHAADVRIIYYPADRPPFDIGIDELQASLVRDQPVSISTKGNIHGFPLGIELQGGTLAELFAPGKRWPLQGLLETDIQDLDFDGYLTDISGGHSLELSISSDLQKQRNPLLSGRPITPLLDRYQLNLSVHKQAKTYLAKLSGGFDGFDLSRIYQRDQRQKMPALKIRGFRMEAQGSGATFSQIVQSVAIDATGSGMEYRHPIKGTARKPYTASFATISARSRGDSGVELLAQGTSGDVPVQLRMSTRNALYALWQRRDVPFDMDIQAKAARGHFAGRLIAPLKQIALDGRVSVKADDLATIGALAGRKWPGSAALAATSAVSFKDRTLRFSAIRGRLGSQEIAGDFTLGFGHGFGLSINAHTGHFDIHDVTRQGRVSGKLVVGLNDVNLSIQGQGDTFTQSLLTGVWQVTAASGRVGWQSRPGEREGTGAGGYAAALHDIRFDTHGQEPATLAAQGLYNGVQFKLAVQAGRLDELPDQVRPYPLSLQITAKDLSGSFQGVVQKPLAAITIIGNLDAQGRLPAIGQLTHASLARDQSADLRGHLAVTRGDVKLTGAVARTDGITVNGDLDYQAAKTPRLTISSSSSSIDLAPYLKHQAKPEQNRAANCPLDRLIVPDVPLDFARQRALDAVVAIKDLKIGYQGKPITLINARFTASNGLYRLDPLQSRSAISDAAILARIEIDASSDPATGSLALQADNFDFGEVIKRLGISNDVTGTLALRVNANGKGRNLRELIGSANGKVQLVADRGSIPKWALEIWGSGLVRLIIPTTWSEDPVTELNCAVARFELTDGVMRSQTLLADTKRVTVAGEAVVNWQNEEIQALFKPQPKDPTLFHLGTPIQLSGTLAHPSVGSAQSGIVSLGKWAIGLTSPAALIVVFGDVGTKEKNPCAALLKESARD